MTQSENLIKELPSSHEGPSVNQTVQSDANSIEVKDESLLPSFAETELEQIADTQDLFQESETKSDKNAQEQPSELVAQLDKLTDPEEKLRLAISFLETSLNQAGTPQLKDFWRIKNHCLLLFKENISQSARVSLWAKYQELSKEARRLKEILDEQSSFAVEQIDIALQALESEITALDEQKEQGLHATPLALCKTLEEHHDFYCSVQGELNVLNSQATRITALRKELIKTEMRIRSKNKLFQRLSAAGDKVFPRRKELIQEISQCFIADIDSFISSNFSEENINDALFFLREEIKILQSIAKVLTLNTHSFTHTRMRLSECWDKIKGAEKERKKERSLHKATIKQNVSEILQKLEAFNHSFQTENPSISDATISLDEIVSFMRSVQLDRDDVHFLREQVNKSRQQLTEKVREEDQKRQEREDEASRLKRQKFLDLKQEIIQLIQSAKNIETAALIEERDRLVEHIQTSTLSKIEKQDLERLFKPLKDVISDKKEAALMELSDDDRQAINQLKTVLSQRKERRQEIKNQIDQLRKSAGHSGFDFEQALERNARLNEEKERLEKISQGVQEIEKKIAELEKKA